MLFDHTTQDYGDDQDLVYYLFVYSIYLEYIISYSRILFLLPELFFIVRHKESDHYA